LGEKGNNMLGVVAAYVMPEWLQGVVTVALVFGVGVLAGRATKR
jgi:hypothetical protein